MKVGHKKQKCGKFLIHFIGLLNKQPGSSSYWLDKAYKGIITSPYPEVSQARYCCSESGKSRTESSECNERSFWNSAAFSPDKAPKPQCVFCRAGRWAWAERRRIISVIHVNCSAGWLWTIAPWILQKGSQISLPVIQVGLGEDATGFGARFPGAGMQWLAVHPFLKFRPWKNSDVAQTLRSPDAS